MLRLIYSPSSRLIQSNTAALQIQSKKVIHISTSIEEYIELTFLRRKLFIKNKKLYNFYTKSYEEGFLKGYEGYKFIKELRRKL